MHRHLGIWGKVKAYKLETQVWIAVAMLVIFILSFIAYQVPAWQENPVASNILLALFTSLLVTVFTMIADIVVSYHSHKNEEFLEDLHEFGIENLHRDKKAALLSLLAECDSMVWISGYRLILTKALKQEFHDSVVRGADLKAVICPPWTDAFKMIYGSNEKVLDNYLQVFFAIDTARMEAGKSEKQVEVVFVDKPIFSDTYRVDQNLITGPYMHNRDAEYHHLMAKDFFSYNIVRQSDLYNIVMEEFKTLYYEARWKLDWNEFEKVYQEVESGDLREAEKIERLRAACVELPPNGTGRSSPETR